MIAGFKHFGWISESIPNHRPVFRPLAAGRVRSPSSLPLRCCAAGGNNPVTGLRPVQPAPAADNRHRAAASRVRVA